MFKITAVKDWIKNKKIITVDTQLQDLVESAIRNQSHSFNWKITEILNEVVEREVRKNIVVEVDKQAVQKIVNEMVSKYDLVKEIEEITKERVTQYLTGSIYTNSIINLNSNKGAY